MPKTVGPQAFVRCIPAEACAENHQVPVNVEGNIFCFLDYVLITASDV